MHINDYVQLNFDSILIFPLFLYAIFKIIIKSYYL